MVEGRCEILKAHTYRLCIVSMGWESVMLYFIFLFMRCKPYVENMNEYFSLIKFINYRILNRHINKVVEKSLGVKCSLTEGAFVFKGTLIEFKKSD